MTDPTFSLEPQPPAPGAGISASGLQPPPPPPKSRARLTGPRLAYVLGFLCTAALLWIRFNSAFGSHMYGVRTPLEVFRDASGAFQFTWDPAQRTVIFLVLAMLGYLALAFAPAGRRRGLAGLALSFFVFLNLGATGAFLSKMMLFIASAGLCGAMWLPAARATVWTRRAFWMSLLVLAAVIWMPIPGTEADVGGYDSAGTLLVEGYLDPPRTLENRELGGFERYWSHFAQTLPPTMGLLILAVGVLVAAGMRARWLWIAAATFLLLMVFGSSLAWAINSGMQHAEPHLDGVQNALYGLGQLWFDQFFVATLPLAAAIREATSN